MAEPELSGLKQERHAKTIEIAQKEVLTCIGICLYDRYVKNPLIFDSFAKFTGVNKLPFPPTLVGKNSCKLLAREELLLIFPSKLGE